MKGKYKMEKMLFHGECVIRQINKLPDNLKPVKSKNGFVRIAESEVTGNHHQVLTKNKDVLFYEKDGVLYAKVDEPTTVECVLKERHDDCTLPIGIWEFKKAVEYDPLEQELRSVAD